jgi:hypothetical protein
VRLNNDIKYLTPEGGETINSLGISGKNILTKERGCKRRRVEN